MTQELIANMLGVRREGVTEAAGRLQAAGMIKYSRGHITVVDPRPRGSHVRMLRGRQERIGSLAAQPRCILIATVMYVRARTFSAMRRILLPVSDERSYLRGVIP